MRSDSDRLRLWLHECPSGFSKMWADALEDRTGDAYRSLDRTFADAIQAARECWGQPTYLGKSHDLVEGDRTHFASLLCEWHLEATLALWRGPEFLAGIALDSHDADSLRTIQMAYRPATVAPK